MAAAVVKLDALANAVGAAAQNQHLAAVGGSALIVAIVARVHVGRVGLKLSSAGVHTLVAAGNGIRKGKAWRVQSVTSLGVAACCSAALAVLSGEPVLGDAALASSAAIGRTWG